MPSHEYSRIINVPLYSIYFTGGCRRAASFYTKPYNSPAHQNLAFSVFLRKMWSLNPNNRPATNKYHAYYKDPSSGHNRGSLHRVAHDQGSDAPPLNSYPAGGECGKQSNNKLKWLKKLPWQWCGHLPVYETPDTGVAFGGILQMRGWKLRNFMNIKSWATPGSVEVVKYDTLMTTNEAPAAWLKSLAQKHPDLHRRSVSVKQASKSLVGGFDLVQGTYKNEKTSFNAAAHSKDQMYRRRCIKNPWSAEDFKYANEFIDWDTEALAGFTKLPENSSLCRN